MWDQSKQQFLGPQQMAEREKRKNPDKQQAPSAPVRDNFFNVVCGNDWGAINSYSTSARWI